MLLKLIDHITINVKDLDATLLFYHYIFGLKRLNTIEMDDHVLNYMELPGGTKLELITYNFHTRSPDVKETDKGTFRHVAFAVDDLQGVAQRCIDSGVKIRLHPVYVEKLRCSTMLIEDPNGIEIELVSKSTGDIS